MMAPIRKHPDVVIDEPVGLHRVIHHRATRKYFKLGVREADFLSGLDGSRDAVTLRTAAPGDFSAEQVDFLLGWFGERGLLDQAVAAEPPPAVRRRLLDWSNPNHWQFTLCDPDRFLDRHLCWVHACFSRPALLAYLLILCLPFCLYALAPQLFADAFSLTAPEFSWRQWLGIYAAMLCVIALHETAHAVACKHYGGEVRKIGVKMLYLQPIVFCDVSSSWRFRDLNQKLAVTAAGIFVQMLVSSICVATWIVLGWPTLWYFACINAVIALFNLLPFIRLDGYWMLVHMLDQPELMKRSQAALDAVLLGLAGRRSIDGRAGGSLAAFGLACRLMAVASWMLGLYTIHRYGSKLSPEVGMALTTLFALLILVRVLHGATALLARFAISPKV